MNAEAQHFTNPPRDACGPCIDAALADPCLIFNQPGADWRAFSNTPGSLQHWARPGEVAACGRKPNAPANNNR